MENESSPACSLAPGDLTERAGAWSQVASRATSRRRQAGGIIASYPREPDLVARLRDLIEAEAKCCPFLEFNVREDATEVIVELRAPEQFVDLFSEMLGLVPTDVGAQP